jgi:hypothetical protein
MDEDGKSEWVFIPSESEVWALAEIQKETSTQIVVAAATQYGGEATSLRPHEVVRISSLESLNTAPPDLIKLLDVNRPAILYTLCKRFNNNEIYTAIGPVLVAVNPFKWITGLYDADLVPKYMSEQLNMSENPHLFAATAGAVRGLSEGFKQSLIISGESGSGKTEATKQCLFFLTAMTDSNSESREESNGGGGAGRTRTTTSTMDQPQELASLAGVQGRILSASPVLEAFGNAKTIRNNNSSRFGKFIEIYLGANQESIESSTNTTYLLEKSRVVRRESEERNYHIFYQVIKGCTADQLASLGLSEMSSNLNKVGYLDGCLTIPGVDDAEEFNIVMQALVSLNFSEAETKELLKIVAGVLHLGQISFSNDPKTDGSKIGSNPTTNHSLPFAATVLGVTEAALKQALLFKTIKTKAGTRTSIMFKPYNKDAATDNRDAMAKEVYTRIFDWIVAKVNEAVNPDLSGKGRYAGAYKNTAGDGRGFIGILDIFGFEIFVKNSLEQLCINLANEALQHHFNYHIFTGEMEMYEREGIMGIKLDYKDNADVLDLLTKHPTGVLCLLDEEIKVPRGSDEGFVSKCIKAHEKNPIFKNRHKVRSFGIQHYAGTVDYTKEGFLAKNNDTLSGDVAELLEKSSLNLMQAIFSPSYNDLKDAELLKSGGGGDTPSKPGPQNKSNKMTVAKRFTLQLDQLVKQLNTTQPKYIRCIKPNDHKMPNEMNKVLVNQQLDYSGVFEAVHIMQSGYPCKLKLHQFVGRFHGLAINLPPSAYGEDKKGSKERRLGGTGGMKAFSSNDGYDDLFPRRKGKVISSNRTAKFESTATRDTASRLIDLLRSKDRFDLKSACSNVVVGKTMVLYRPESSDVLEKALSRQRRTAVRFLQKNFRGSMYNRLTNAILKPYKELKKAIAAKDGPRLKELLKEDIRSKIDGLERLVGSSFAAFHGSISYGHGGGYGLEVNRKSYHVAEEASEVLNMHTLLKNRLVEDLKKAAGHPDVIFDVYDELCANVKLLKDNSLVVDNYPYKFDRWEWNWEQDDECPALVRTVEKYALVVTIKRRFDQHSDSINEGDLTKALEDLMKLRSSGDLPPNYCLKEEKRAKDIIMKAVDIYMEYYDAMIEALGEGGMKVVVDGGGVDNQGAAAVSTGVSDAVAVASGTGQGSLTDLFSSDLEYTVNSKMLSGVFNQWDMNQHLHEQSKKTSDLVEIGRNLIYLREFAENKQWDLLWGALNKSGWMKLIPRALKADVPVPRRMSIGAGRSVEAMSRSSSTAKLPSHPSQGTLASTSTAGLQLSVAGSVDELPPPPTKTTPRPKPTKPVAAVLKEEEVPIPPLKEKHLIQLYTHQRASYFIDALSGQAFWTVPKGVSFSSVLLMSHISDDGDEGAKEKGEVEAVNSDLKVYYENVKTRAVTWELPSDIPEDVMARIDAMHTGLLTQCEEIVGAKYDHNVSTEHLVAIDDYLECGDLTQAIDNDGYSATDRIRLNTEVEARNKTVKAANASALATAAEEEQKYAVAIAAAAKEELDEGDEEDDQEDDSKQTVEPVGEEGGLTSLELLHVMGMNDDVYDGDIAIGQGIIIPKGLEGVLGREVYNLCFACLHYSCFREIAAILTDTRTLPDELINKDLANPTYSRRISATGLIGDDPNSFGDEGDGEKKSEGAAFEGDDTAIELSAEGSNPPDMITMHCSGLELDLGNLASDSWTKLITLISESEEHRTMMDSNQTCLYYLAKRHTMVQSAVFDAGTDPDYLESVIAQVTSTDPMPGETSPLAIDATHGDIIIAQSALAFYRYREALSKQVFMTLSEKPLPLAVLPRGRKNRRGTQPQGDHAGEAPPPPAWEKQAAVSTALDYNSLGRVKLNAFEKLIEGVTDRTKCPPIQDGDFGDWADFMSIAEVAWTVRGAINEVDSARVNISSIKPLSDEDNEEVIAVLALLEAIKEYEPWVKRYQSEVAALSLGVSPPSYSSKGGDNTATNAGSESRGRTGSRSSVSPTSSTPTTPGSSRSASPVPDEGRAGGGRSMSTALKEKRRTKSSSGDKKRKSKSGSKSSKAAPPPPSSAPPPEKVAAAKARQASKSALVGMSTDSQSSSYGVGYQYDDSNLGKSMFAHMDVVMQEINRIERELKHTFAIADIANALAHGGVVGEVGHLRIEEIDYTTLPAVLAKRTPEVLMNQNIKLLMEDAELIVSLRKLIMFKKWDEVGRQLQPIVDVDPMFNSVHANCRDELLLISMELVDFKCKKKLNSALEQGRLEVVQTLCKGVTSDPMGVDVLELLASSRTGARGDVVAKLEGFQDDLQSAIREVEHATYRTPEVHQLLFDAKVTYALRHAAIHNQWEPLLTNQKLTWGGFGMEQLAALLCTSNVLTRKGLPGGSSCADLVASHALSDRDPLLTVLGKSILVVDHEPADGEPFESSNKPPKPAPPGAAPPPPPGHGHTKRPTMPGAPPPPPGHSSAVAKRPTMPGAPPPPARPTSDSALPPRGKVHFDESLPFSALPAVEEMPEEFVHVDEVKKRRLVVDSPMQASAEEKVACATQVIEALNSLSSPMSSLRVPLVSIAIESVTESNKRDRRGATLSVGEIISYLEHVGNPPKEASSVSIGDVIGDLPPESWETKFSHADSVPRTSARMASIMASTAATTVAGHDLPDITRVVSDVCMDDINNAIRLIHDRRARVILAVSVMAGTANSIQALESEVNHQVEAYHRSCERHEETGDDEMLALAPQMLRHAIDSITPKYVDKSIAKRGLKSFYTLLRMTKEANTQYSASPFDPPPVTIETTQDGMGMLSKGYLSETVRCWWLASQHLVHIRSAIMAQVDEHISNQMHDNEDDRRQSTLRRRRASTMLDDYCVGTLSSVAADDSEDGTDKEKVSRNHEDENELMDEHFEVQANQVGLLHVNVVGRTLRVLKKCDSLPTLSATSELTNLRKHYEDSDHREALLLALSRGGPTYDVKGRFQGGSKNVQTGELARCIADDSFKEAEYAQSGSADGPYFRSSRMLRLLEFAKLALKLRQGLVDDNWSANEYALEQAAADKKAAAEKAEQDPDGENSEEVGDDGLTIPLRSVVSAFHELMRKYGTSSQFYDDLMSNSSRARAGSVAATLSKQGNSLEHEHLEGIPPKRLVQDFVMVEHELQKVDIITNFPTDYRQGMLGGESFRLELQHIGMAGLERAVRAINHWRHQKRLLPVPREFKERMDTNMVMYLKAAQEIIKVRREIKAINDQFRRPISVSSSTGHLHVKDLMSKHNIVGSAVGAAIENCGSLFGLPENITQIWDRVDTLVSYNCINASKLPFIHHELRLVKEESLSRRFLWAQVRVFNGINHHDIVANKNVALETLSELASNFQKFNEDLKVLSKFAGRQIKPCAMVESVATSSALLFHLIRAQLLSDCYEKLMKDNEAGAFEVPAVFEQNDDSDDGEETRRQHVKANTLHDKKAKALLAAKDEHRRLGSRLRRRRDNVDAILHALAPVEEEPHGKWRTCNKPLTSDGLVDKLGTPSPTLLKLSCGGSCGDQVATDVRNTVELVSRLCAPRKKRQHHHNGKESLNHAGSSSDDDEDASDTDEEEIKGAHATLAELEAAMNGDHHSYAAMMEAREEHDLKRQCFQVFSVQSVVRCYFRHTECEDIDSATSLGTLQVSAFKLHPVVRRKFLNAIQDVANAFDIFDMKRALSVEHPKGMARGQPGEVNYDKVDNSPLIEVLSRIREEKDEINRFNLVEGFTSNEMASYVGAPPARKAPAPPGSNTSGRGPIGGNVDFAADAAEKEGESASFQALYADLGAELYPESFRRQLALKYLRMSNMLPVRVVRARMRSEGLPESDIDTFFDNIHQGAGRAGSHTPHPHEEGSSDPTHAGPSGTSTVANPVSWRDATYDHALSHRRKKTAEESQLLQRSCEIVACMRDLVVRQDYRSGFDLLEMFITPIAEEAAEEAAVTGGARSRSNSRANTPKGKSPTRGGAKTPPRNGVATSKSPGSKPASSAVPTDIRIFYNLVHDHCRTEFELLTMDICMGFWRALEGSTLAPGVYLKIYTSLLMLSEQSPAMRKLCGESIRLIDEGRAGDLSQALGTSPGKKGEDSEETRGEDERKEKNAAAADGNKVKKRLPPLKETPAHLQPAASKKAGAPKMLATEYSASSAITLAETETDASVISRNEQGVLVKKNLQTGAVVKTMSHSAAQTDGTDLLEVVDPVYHLKHQELVKSKEDATRRLAAMRAEKERVLSLLHLREIESSKKVKQKEEESIAIIQRMWDNDAKRVTQMKNRIEEERMEYELDLKAQRHAEHDIHSLYQSRRSQLGAAAVKVHHHHEAVVGQRKYVAHTRLRADLGTRKLHNILSRKAAVARQREKNLDLYEEYKRDIELSSSMLYNAAIGNDRMSTLGNNKASVESKD